MNQQKLFHKDFTLVVVGQIISLFGNGIVRFALPLYLLSVTGSAALFGMVTALSFLPMVLLTPIGGILADRVNKRNIMVALDFITAGLILVFFLLLGKVNLIVLLVITLMILFAIQGAYQPTVQASIPLLASKEHLLSANAIINQVGALSGLLAPIFGGILYGAWGLNPILILGGICFFISAVMELFIYIPHEKIHCELHLIDIVKQDFRDSFSFISKDKPVILKTIGIFFLFNLFLSAMVMVAMPVLITQTLRISDQLYGFSQGASAAGALFGGILVGIFAKKLKIKHTYLMLLTCSLFLLPIAISLMVGAPAFVSYLIISICCFCFMSIASMVSIQLLTFIQGETPAQLIGKVISCVMALCMCAQPIGQAMYGFLLEVFATTPHWIVFGASFISTIISLMSKQIFSRFAEH